jgi:hypothetical protein
MGDDAGGKLVEAGLIDALPGLERIAAYLCDREFSRRARGLLTLWDERGQPPP